LLILSADWIFTKYEYRLAISKKSKGFGSGWASFILKFRHFCSCIVGNKTIIWPPVLAQRTQNIFCYDSVLYDLKQTYFQEPKRNIKTQNGK